MRISSGIKGERHTIFQLHWVILPSSVRNRTVHDIKLVGRGQYNMDFFPGVFIANNLLN